MVYLFELIGSLPVPLILEILIDMSVKAAVLCAVSGMASLALYRSSAYVRKMVWVSTIVALLLLPLASVIMPTWHLNLLPSIGSLKASSDTGGGRYPLKVERVEGSGVEKPRWGGSGASSLFGLPAGAGWSDWILFAWLSGMSLFALWIAFVTASMNRVRRRARPANDSWRETGEEIAGRLGLTRHIGLLSSEQIGAAVTVGVVKPVVVLPRGADAWPSDRRNLVLAHELAHVKRRDGMIEVLASIARCVHWFNPVVWFAVGRLRIERERVCDDTVLNLGVRPSDYAALLMDIAAELGSPPKPLWLAATISQGASLKDRLLCILDPARDRRPGTRITWLATAALVVALMLPLSAFGLWRQVPSAVDAASELVGEWDRDPSQVVPLTGTEAEKKKEEDLGIEEKWRAIESSEKSAAAEFMKVLETKGLEKALKTYMVLRTKKADEFHFKEGEFNLLGYVLLKRGKLAEALKVFEINVKEYPDSWNVYDSLGEGYLHAGKLDLARKYILKSLELNPDNENGKKMLEMIEKKEKGKA